MNTRPERIIFNACPSHASQTGDSAVYLRSNDPVIQLEVAPYQPNDVPQRVEPQREELERLQRQGTIKFEDLVFGNALDWPFYEYKVTNLSKLKPGPEAPSTPAEVWGTAPSQPVPDGSEIAATDGHHPYAYSCLFSVIVALEWEATPEYIEQLKWAFRSASDFLYDVTDGYFAFGQIVIGGPELMSCADVQVMASNRLLPRSWVSGLHESLKYMPIRVGRGVWHKNNRVSIPWDEPEAFRTLVHEWAHYGLELRDAYLETHHVAPASSNHAHSAANVLVRGTYPVVIPQISITAESIMASLEGTSELVPRMTPKGPWHDETPWELIKRKNRYKFLDLDPHRQPLQGPGRVPVPLPTCHVVGSLADDRPGKMPAEAVLKDFPKDVQFDHCWVYVIKGNPTNPQNLIAQGSIDSRAEEYGFRLLGVAAQDTVVLIGRDYGDRAVVVSGTIAEIRSMPGGDAEVCIQQWLDATPDHFPMIDIVPSFDLLPDDQLAEIKVRIEGQYDRPAWVFPLGVGGRLQIQPDTFLDVPTLDGHVLVIWEQGRKVAISSFSQGGNPQTGTPTGGPPITAGSSEGNSMLFFADKNQIRDYSNTKVVTTLVHVDSSLDTLPDGAQARSYAFSLACNTPLPTEIDPTLILYFDRESAAEGGDLVVYRQESLDGKTWKPVLTYKPKNSFFVAAPLNVESASRLVATNPPVRVERYRLYWKPRNAHSTNGQPNLLE
ncbi:MAG TPA: hypothetical protein VFZ66_20105 [Herpetosiphonaceae bacterium]